MKNIKLFLVVLCFLAAALFIIWVAVSSNFIELVIDNHLPLPVFWEYYSENSGDVAVSECGIVGNGTSIYVVSNDLSPMTWDTYFNTNGSLICKEESYADRTYLLEGTSCPQMIACEDIAFVLRD